MFERFTDRARRTVVLAQEEARGLQHNHIGTEHLLLGLLHEGEGLAARALHAVGLTTDGLRGTVEETTGRGTEPPKGHIPFTPRAKIALELALRTSLRLDHQYIGTEHVLLGVLEEGEGVAVQILEQRVDGGPQRVADEVHSLLSASGSTTGETLERIQEQLRGRSTQGLTLTGPTETAAADDIRARLDAIEARLSAIEQLLREQRGEESAS